MNLRTTLALLVLAAIASVLVAVGPHLPSWLDPAPSRPQPPDEGTRDELARMNATKFKHIEINKNGRVTLLQRKPNGDWALPGNWPVRNTEADALAERIAGLRTRFEPERLVSDADFQKTGLRPEALSIRVVADDAVWKMSLGEGREGTNDTPFTRPTYLRLGDHAEAVRLAPGLIRELDHPPEYYQQRRLFPGERIVKDADSGEKVERLSAASVRIQDTKKDAASFSLVHKGDNWEIENEKIGRDRPEARARDALLTAVPDIWAEYFIHEDAKTLRPKTGLDHPERTLTVVRSGGDPVKLLIGQRSATRTRKVLRQPPPGAPPGLEPREEAIPEEYLYAQLENNDQIFEIKADKLKDVFVPLDQFRDSQVASFSTADAQRVELHGGKEKIVLVKDKERWKLLEPVTADAEPAKVTDLLSKLSGLTAQGADVIDKGDPKTYGLDKPSEIVVTLEEETKGPKGEKSKKQRTLTIKVGKHDAAMKKLYVQADAWPRINAVEDSLDALVHRPAIAYRSRRVFDFSAADLAKLEVERGGGKYVLERGKDGWQVVLGKPVEADTLKVDQLASTLSALEAVEYASESPKAEELESKYGLGKPAVLVRLELSAKQGAAGAEAGGKKNETKTLAIGKPRTGAKSGRFARLVDGDKPTPVFVIPGDVFSSLDHDALAYLPTQLWQAFPEDVNTVRIRRAGEEEYRLVRDGAGWKVGGAFDAPAMTTTANNLVTELASAHCTSYKTHEAKELAEWGLDKPHLSVTLSAKGNKEHTLLIGGPVKDGGRYGKLADRPAVFVVGDPLVKNLDRSALDLLDPVLLRLDPAQVQRIESKAGDTTLTLAPKGERWEVSTGAGAPFVADTFATDTLRSIWFELRAQRFAGFGKVEWAKYGLDKPAVVVTVTTKSADKPATHTVEVGGTVEGAAGARYARVDKGGGLAVLPESTAKVLTATKLDYVEHQLLDFKADAVQSVKRQAAEDVLELVKKESWQIVKPAELKADDRAVTGLLAQLSGLRAKRIAEYPAKDLQRFGLDKPAAVVTIKINAEGKASEHVLRIGKAAAGTDRFAQVEGSTAVGVLPGSLVDRLLAGPLAFRDRTVAGFADADRVRLNWGPRGAVFTLVDGNWKLTEPLEDTADHDELAEFVNSLAKLRADELVVEKPTADELKKYGLDRPEVHWRLEGNNKEVMHLLVGNAEEAGGRRYAMVEGKPLVFLLDLKLTARVLGEYRPRAVWVPPMDAVQIESVRYSYARNSFTLVKADGGWEIAGKPDLKLNPDTVNETLAAVANLKMARYAIDKGADLKLFGLDHPELVLEVTTRLGKRTLEVGGLEGGSKRRYARIPAKDRSDVFVLDEGDLVRILRDANAFTKAPLTLPPPSPPDR